MQTLYDAFTGIPDSGMARFLSPLNLARYRRLAARKTSAVERNRLLKLLAREWSAFLQECHTSSSEEIVFRRQGDKITPGAKALDIGLH